MKQKLSVMIICCLSLTMLAGCSVNIPENGLVSEDAALSAPALGDTENGAPAQAEDPDIPADEVHSTISGEPAVDGESRQADPASPNAPDTPSAGDAQTPADNDVLTGEELLHVTVETVRISAADLKAQDYTVSVLVTLDKNPGIVYSEWGLQVDPKCTFSADSDEMSFNTFSAVNEEKHFIWTAWGSANVSTKTGSILCVTMHLPEDAAPGTLYSLTYADMSLADKGHVFSSSSVNYAETAGTVGWTDGGVLVTE